MKKKFEFDNVFSLNVFDDIKGEIIVKYPHIKFVIASPTYCEWYKGERQFDLGAYTEAARSVSEEMGTDFIDMYHAFGKTPEEKLQYLEDGVHLTAEGRWLYSRSIIDFLDTQK